MGWTVRGSKSGGARFSASVQTGPGAHPASCTMGTGSFPGLKSGQAVTLTPNPLLVPWSRKGRAILLLPLRIVRPVQSLSACTRVHFTLLYCVRDGGEWSPTRFDRFATGREPRTHATEEWVGPKDLRREEYLAPTWMR
jgi:hypothetical protein